MKYLYHILLSILNFFDNFSKEKLTYSAEVNDISVLTDSGYQPVTSIHETKPFVQYIVKTTNHELTCADNHIVVNKWYEQVFVKDLNIGDVIMTDCGPEAVTSIKKLYIPVAMCDLTVNSLDHLYYTNGILSHNTTTTALACLHYLLFNIDKNALICSNKRKSAVEVVDKIKKIYSEIPFFLKPGIHKWNVAEIVMDNGCRIQAEATTINSGIGDTIHFLILDEFAHIKPNIMEKFYNNIFPTVTASKAKCTIISTQNGRNLFYRLYKAAQQGDNDYKPFEIQWSDIPEWNPETQTWDKRDEAWHSRQVANYGSEEAFNSQFGTNFDISSNTLISQKKLNSAKMVTFINKDIPGVYLSDCWYWHPDYDPTNLKSEFLVFTCDLAEGIGQDYTVFSLYRMVHHGTDDLECIGYFRSNKHAREQCAESLMNLITIWCYQEHTLLSFERNTYGEIFLKDINELAEKKFPTFDPGVLVKYYTESGTKFHYGIKITAGNKTTHCVIFKESFERGKTINEAEQFIYELQNFCDDGTGHYKASFGHDDAIMTAVQLEFVRKELQYRMMRDDFEMGVGYQDENIWNPYDDSVVVEQTAWDKMNQSRLK